MTRRLLDLVDDCGYRSVASRDPERLAGTVAVDVPEAARVAKTLNARDFVVDYRPGVGHPPVAALLQHDGRDRRDDGARLDRIVRTKASPEREPA